MQSTNGLDGSIGAGTGSGAFGDAAGAGMLGNNRFKSENTPSNPAEHSKEQAVGTADSSYSGTQGSS